MDENIKKYIFDKWKGDMDWIDLFQELDRSRDLVNAVINLLVP